MDQFTFKDFLDMIQEDLDADLTKLQSDLSNIDMMINQRTAPLLAQKQRIQKMLQQKQNQRKAQAPKPQQAATPQAQTQQAQMQPGQHGQ